MSADDNYRGRRATEASGPEKPSTYSGRRRAASEEPAPIQPFVLPQPAPKLPKRDILQRDYSAEEPVDPPEVDRGPKLLEGDDSLVNMPEGWENQGSSFNYTKGRHAALVESVWSTEVDGGIMESPITKKRPTLYIVLSSLLVVLLVGAGALYFLNRDTGPVEPQGIANVLPQALPDAPNVGDSIIRVTQKGKGFEASSGGKLQAAGAPVITTPDECVVEESNQICLAGLYALGEQPGRVFYSRDLVHNPTFSMVNSYTPFEHPEVALAADVNVQFQGEPTRFLLFIKDNSEGWFVEIPSTVDPETFQKFVSTVKVS